VRASSLDRRRFLAEHFDCQFRSRLPVGVRIWFERESIS
jgi:hypothetical protein